MLLANENPKVELSGAVESGSFNGIGIDEGFALATMQDHAFQFSVFKVLRVAINLVFMAKFHWRLFIHLVI